VSTYYTSKFTSNTQLIDPLC